jgi:hypothetical protein
MATIGQNSLWSDLETGASNVDTDVMGPSYSYADNIEGPSQKGVGSSGTMSQVSRNTGAAIDYVKNLVSGPALGNQYFINTGGTCVAPDKSTQSRYSYINNIASGADLLPQSMRNELSSLTSDFNGLIPGMLEDVEGLNPVSLFTAIAADSTPTCECYTCPTSGGNQSRFMNTSLSPDYDPAICTQVDPSLCVQSSEGFTDGSSSPLIPLAALGLLAILTCFN